MTDIATEDSYSDDLRTDAPPQRRRGVRVLAWILGSMGTLLVLATIGIVIWSQVGVMAAEPEQVAAVRSNPAISVADDGAAIVLTPTGGATGEGLVFYPGAKVDPWAYAAKLSGLVEEGTTVVIVRPWLNLALFDLRPVSTFTDLAPEVADWAVGGHSLGGVRACQSAEEVGTLVLFGSYCAGDIAGTEVAALSVSGSEDLLSSPEKIEGARDLLPGDAEFVEIEGAGHSSFGDYGLQPGDGTPAISDDDMTAQLTEAIAPFLSR